MSGLKIRPEHYAELREAFAAVPPENIAGHRAMLQDDPRVKDLDKRLRWDILWFVRRSAWVCDTLYPYMDDSHLDSALRAIMREVCA